MDIEEFIADHQRRRQYAEEDDAIPAWLAKERDGNPLLVTTDSAALSDALEAQVSRWRNRDEQAAKVLPLRQLNMAALGQGDVVYGAASILGAFDGLLAGLLDNSHTTAARNAYDTAYQSLGASIRLSKLGKGCRPLTTALSSHGCFKSNPRELRRWVRTLKRFSAYCVKP